MNLKFMQRRQAQQQACGGAATSPAATSASPASGSGGATAAAAGTPGPGMAAARSDAEWTLESVSADRGAAPTPHVLLREPTEPDGTAALLQFRAGRRSFGGANPRLEKRLAEIGTNQRVAREEIAAAARAADERRRLEAEHMELMRKANEEEEIERKNGVSDAEMAQAFAAKYAKYVPPPPPAKRAGPPQAAPRNVPAEPPVVSNPVRVRDAPQAKGEPSTKRPRQGR